MTKRPAISSPSDRKEAHAPWRWEANAVLTAGCDKKGEVRSNASADGVDHLYRRRDRLGAYGDGGGD